MSSADRPPRLRPISPGTIADNVASPDGIDDTELVALLYEALATLPPAERAAAMIAVGLGEGAAGVAVELDLEPEDADALTRSALQLLRGYRQVLGLAAVVFLANLAQYVYPSIFVLFAGYLYGWGPKEVSWVLALVGVCNILVNVFLIGRVVSRFGERRTLLFGLACGVVGFVI